MKSCLVINDRELISTNILDNMLDQLRVTWRQNLDGKSSAESIFAEHQDTQILVTTYMQLDAGILRMLPRLELIVAMTTAVEYIDLEYCAMHGISVYNIAGYTHTAVAEYAFSLLLAVAKQTLAVDHRVRAGESLLADLWGIELAGKQLGVLGLGTNGSAIARIAQGFGMRVIYTNRSRRAMPFACQVSLRQLLCESDVVAVALPLNNSTRGMLGAAEIAMMKRSSILVSTSPEAIIDLGALTGALKEGKIAGAGLDFVGELPAQLALPNTVLSSRFGARTAECFARKHAAWSQTLNACLNGECPPGRVV